MARVHAWETEESYHVGDHVRWGKARLVCTREHYAGPAAEHPWDPGHGWGVLEAAALWTPISHAHKKNLLSELGVIVQEPDDTRRLEAVILAACGVL